MRFEGGYLVPRADGRYALGATVEEQGFELSPTAGGVYELLRDASELVPGIDELRIEELSVGLRPCTPDNAPAIGRGALEGLVWATGHHRNGILLAPLTAELVPATLTGEGPARLAPRRARSAPRPARLTPRPGRSSCFCPRARRAASPPPEPRLGHHSTREPSRDPGQRGERRSSWWRDAGAVLAAWG